VSANQIFGRTLFGVIAGSEKGHEKGNLAVFLRRDWHPWKVSVIARKPNAKPFSRQRKKHF